MYQYYSSGSGVSR